MFYQFVWWRTVEVAIYQRRMLESTLLLRFSADSGSMVGDRPEGFVASIMTLAHFLFGLTVVGSHAVGSGIRRPTPSCPGASGSKNALQSVSARFAALMDRQLIAAVHRCK